MIFKLPFKASLQS